MIGKMRNKSVFLFVIAVLFSLSVNAFAQDVSVEAEINARKIVLGGGIQLTITVHGKKNLDALTLPNIDGFESSYLGPSTKMSIVNGQYSSSTSFHYSLIPLRAGILRVPSMTVEIDGTTFTTNAIDVEVLEQADQANESNNGSSQPFTKLSEKIFLQMTAEKTELYLNEAVNINFKLYFTNIALVGAQPPDFEAIGFIVEDYGEDKQYQQVVNGVRYNVIEVNANIYPTRTGELIVGPAKMAATIVTEDPGQSSFHSRGSIFVDDFFNSFFKRQVRQPIEITSNKIDFNVKMPPEEGRPEGFSNATGRFAFDVSVSPVDVKTGDPITVKMKVDSNGNVKTVQLPSYKENDQFKVYEPIIKEVGKSKYLEQVIIPKNNDVAQVPKVEFSYFDVDEKQYKTITKGPFTINVQDSEEPDYVAPTVKESISLPSNEEKIGQDIVFIKSAIGPIRPKGSALYKNGLFYLLAMILYAGLFGLFIIVREKKRFKTDTRYARKLQAPKYAQRGLNKAKQLIEQNKLKDAYDVLFRTMQDYFAHKLHLPFGSITVERIEGFVMEKTKNKVIVEKLSVVFDRCDQVRYASVSLDRANTTQSYNTVIEIIDYFERENF